MNEKSKLLPAIVVCGIFALAFITLGVFIGRENFQENFQPKEPTDETLAGSGSFYGYSSASSTTFASTKIKQIKTGQTILGSVVIASSSATSLKLKNAASTTDIASTTIATIVAAADEGTFIFDLSASRGLIIESSSGFNGNFVITYQ